MKSLMVSLSLFITFKASNSSVEMFLTSTEITNSPLTVSTNLGEQS